MAGLSSSTHLFVFISLLAWWIGPKPCLASNPSLEGRYSFSLTTFNPKGKLGQVERAMMAASLGTPIVAVIRKDGILMASPQILPSPLMEDDGTSRFAAVTPDIALAHTGIAADGRILVAAAQRLAVEHAFTFGERIPIDLFLEELSLLFQEYTMKPGTRPFGATLLVAHLPTDGKAQLFRLDPSGAVLAFDKDYAIVNGDEKLKSTLEVMAESLVEGAEKQSLPEQQPMLSRYLEAALGQRRAPSPAEEKGSLPLPSSIVSASLTSDGLKVNRRRLFGETRID